VKRISAEAAHRTPGRFAKHAPVRHRGGEIAGLRDRDLPTHAACPIDPSAKVANPPLAFSPAKLLKDRIAGRIVLARFPTLAGSPGRSPSALSDPSWPAFACTAVSLLRPPAHRVGADLPCVEGHTCRVPVRCRSRRVRALPNSDPPTRSCCELIKLCPPP
jgi:hypothetical protein